MPARDLEIFLRFIFPWDDPKYDHLYKCVSTIFPKNGSSICINHAVQSYDDIIKLIDNRSGWRHGDVYVALGTQRMASSEMSQDGYNKAVRKAQNMVSFNSLFVDIDVGKNGTYATDKDAELGLQQFLKSSGMPQPTMIVHSGGGGMHLYWCTPEPMTVEVWQPLAEALKACAKQLGFKIDMSVTADSARILRVPTTFNHKYGTPVAVLLDTANSAFVQYTATSLQGVLSAYMGAQRSKTGTGSSAPTGSVWTQNFTANVDERAFPKLPIDTIAVNCPMTAQTLLDGGAGKAEPDWSQDMFLAAWTDDPVAAAHRLSQGHVGYNPADTDKKLAEKQAAIVSANLGWPKCSSFNHAACKTCPLLVHDKSPVLFGHRVTPAAQPLQPKYTVDEVMPEGYWRNANDHVITNGEHGPIDVLGYPILDGYIDATTGEVVVQTAVSNRDRWGSVSVAKQTGAGVCEAWTKGTRNGIVIKGNTTQQVVAKNFTMAWMTHLQNRKRTITPHGCGWHGDGFVFGDEIFTPTGPQSTYRGSAIDENYQRVGELQPWLDAMQLIYGTAPLEILVASSFAAPLVKLACDNSLVLSIYSNQSGYGKSTAMKLALSVWGRPREGMSMLDDTPNSGIKKMTDLKNLPFYWDELKTKDQMDKMVQVVFAATQGRSKGRLSRDSQQMPIGTATTMLAVASNHGIADAVIQNTDGTEAGGLRVFEFEALPIVNKVPVGTDEGLIIALHENYGVAGALYADYIVRNKAVIKQIIVAISEQLQQNCQFETKERFWKNVMVTILAGAHVANTAGLTTFDITAMQAYLVEALHTLRMNPISQPYAMSGNDAGEDVLAEMQADLRNRNLLVTDIVPGSAGRPVTVMLDPYCYPEKMGDLWMQIGKLDGKVLVRMRPFHDWLRKRNRSPAQVIKALKADYYVNERKANIGTGVIGFDALTKRSRCYFLEPKKPPPPPPSRNLSSPFSSSGSPSQ